MNTPLPKLDGPRIRPASGGTAKQLVVFLHGYGADGNDLIALGQHWRQLLPDAAFLSPHAPEVCGANPFGGRQWFELTSRDPAERWRGVQAAAPLLNTFLDSQLAAFGLNDSALALVGFSQGAMMGLHVGLRRLRPAAAVVSFSGMLIEPGRLGGDIASRPPVLLVHGDADEVVPVSSLNDARVALAAAKVAIEWHIRPGLGHGIDNEGLDLGGRFLVNAFKRGGGETGR